LLEYDGWINLSTLRSIEQSSTNPVSGVVSVVRRLCGIGIFNDPNDLCLLLVATATLCLGFTGCRDLGRLRRWMYVPVIFFLYAIVLTQSRGGFLSLLGVIGTLLVIRYGRGQAILAAIVLVPVIFTIFAGRQTQVDFSDPDDTFQTRLNAWNDSLDLFKQSPIFGVGQEQQEELRGSVAHNSFIQSFAELGIVGGACFLGAFAIAISGLRRTKVRDADPELARLRPIMLAIVVGYGIGLLSLSRAYTPSTYLILGLAAAYINLTPRLRPLRLSLLFAERLAVASILFIVRRRTVSCAT
jgi:putative inorganic carbon (hco3(-)) transporter